MEGGNPAEKGAYPVKKGAEFSALYVVKIIKGTPSLAACPVDAAFFRTVGNSE
jgi:hypothetical protein